MDISRAIKWQKQSADEYAAAMAARLDFIYLNGNQMVDRFMAQSNARYWEKEAAESSALARKHMGLESMTKFQPDERFIVLIDTGKQGREKWQAETWNGGGTMGTDTYEWGPMSRRLPVAMNFDEASRVAARAKEGLGRGYGPPPMGEVHMFELIFNDVTPANMDDIIRREAMAKLNDEEKRVLGLNRH